MTAVLLLCTVFPAITHASLYFSTSSTGFAGGARLRRINEDGTNPETLVTLNPDSGRSVAVDPIGLKVYFATSGQNIFRSNLDGSGQELLLSGIGGNGQDIELDLNAGKLYYASQSSRIVRANLDGSGFEVAADFQATLGNIGIVGLALDTTANKMYFTDTSHTDSIYRSNFDGSNLETLVSFATNVDLEDIEVDPSGGKIYWTDKLTGKLQRANLDGSMVEDLVTNHTFGRHLALDIGNGKVYWTGDGIRSANLDGSNIAIIHPNEGDPHGIDIGPSSSQAPAPIPEPSTFITWSLLWLAGIVGYKKFA